MIKENKPIKHPVTAERSGKISLSSKKASVLSWRTLLDKESAMSCSKTENKHLKNEHRLGCHLFYKPLNKENTLYEFRVLPVLYVLSTVKESVRLCGGYCYFLHLDQAVECDFFEKKIDKKALLPVIRHAVLALLNDCLELKRDQGLFKDVFFSLPRDKELIKCIDYEGKNRPWEYKYQTKH